MIDLKALQDRLQTMKATYNAEVGKKDQLEQLIQEQDVKVAKLKFELDTFEKTRILLVKTADEAREVARKRLETIVSSALQYVFGPDFEFKIELKESRGRAEANFYVISNQGGKPVQTDPLAARGGGVVDIIAIALQLAVTQIHHNPIIRGPILLDEPGKHVDAENAVKLAMFIQEMSKQFDRQILMPTHQPHLAQIADTAFQVELKGGKSVVTQAVNGVLPLDSSNGNPGKLEEDTIEEGLEDDSE